MIRTSFSINAALFLGVIIAAVAQADPLDNEVKRLQGAWRVTEMVENGRVMSKSEMRNGLPGGGLADIIDCTVIFKSPVNGVRSTRSFRIDPTTYPKQIVILDRDKVTGVGIYQLDQGKFVICVAGPRTSVPTEFSAPERSGRTLMVMEPHQVDQGDIAKISLPPPPRITKTTSSQTATVKTNPPLKTTVPDPSASVAGRILSDADVVRMMIGTWQLNDGEGLVDITINANKTFSAFRHTQTMSNFHSVFVPKPVSAGTWAVQKGQLTLTITSSWRSDRQNTRATFAVRSISSSDAIIVDSRAGYPSL